MPKSLRRVQADDSKLSKTSSQSTSAEDNSCGGHPPAIESGVDQIERKEDALSLYYMEACQMPDYEAIHLRSTSMLSIAGLVN